MLRTPESDADYLDLLARVRGTPEGKKLYFSYDLEKNQRDGQASRYQAYAWLLDENPGAGGSNPEATLVYEIRPEHPYDRRGTAQYPSSRGRSVPGSACAGGGSARASCSGSGAPSSGRACTGSPRSPC